MVGCLRTSCFNSRRRERSATFSINGSRKNTSAFGISIGALCFTADIKLSNARENSWSVSPLCCRLEKNASCKATYESEGPYNSRKIVIILTGSLRSVAERYLISYAPLPLNGQRKKCLVNCGQMTSSDTCLSFLNPLF